MHAVIVRHIYRGIVHDSVTPCASGGYEPGGAGREGIGAENALAAAGWRQYTGAMWEPGWGSGGIDYGVFFILYRNPDGSLTAG